MHKWQVILITIYFVSLTAESSVDLSTDQHTLQDTANLNGGQTLTGSIRSRYKLPKIFNFDYYQHVFKKQYSSVIEKAARARLYLGRAFRAFISVVSYKHRKSNSYLAINEMSDWTSNELEKTMMDSNLLLANDNEGRFIRKEVVPIDDNLAVDLPSIELEFNEITEHKDSGPFYKYIADELSQTDHQIKRRDLRASLRDYSLNDLVIKGGKQIKVAGSKLINQLEPIETMPLQMGEMIGSIKDNKYLKSVVQKFSTTSQSDEKRPMQPDSIDIDHRKCLLEPRTQGKCGCCYAFAAVALYEWAYCRATGERIAFSEQYVIDCGNKSELSGCSAGYTHKVRKFVVSDGLELRSDYPYHAREQECLYGSAVAPETRGTLRILDKGWDYVHLNSIERQLRQAPLVVNLYVERGTFQEYGGGVDSAEGCLGKRKGMHSLLLVGSGREDGIEYWLMRNSFGKRWGELGYYKMNKESGCIIPYSGLVLSFPEQPEIIRNTKAKTSSRSKNDWKQLFV